MKTLDVQKARQLGYSDQEIIQFMESRNLAPKVNFVDQTKNIVKGGGKFIKNLVQAPGNLINLGKGLSSGDIKASDVGRGLVQSYKDKYGGWDELARTAYFEPVDMLSDISLASGLAAKGVNLAAKGSKLGQGLSQVSSATNPLNIMTKGGKTLMRPASKLFAKKDTADVLDDFSSALAKKSLRPSPSQQKSFKAETGMDIGDYARDMNLQGSGDMALKKITPIAKSLQKKYNILARSGKPINPKDFIAELKKQADKITQKDFSPEARLVAKNIRDRAYEMELNSAIYMIKNKTNTIPIDILTETKSSAFAKVPAGTMADPTKMHGGKFTGGVGIKSLEKLAPGSQKLGKAQQAALSFQDIASQQAGLGKGTQMINMFKPSGYGSVMGGVLGGVPGAIVGGATSMAANSPRVLGGASKALHTGANLMRGAKLPNVSRFTSKLPEVAKYSQPLGATQTRLKEERQRQQPERSRLNSYNNNYTRKKTYPTYY